MKDRKLLIGYVTSSALPSVTAEDAQKMTHVNVAFGHVTESRVTVASTHNLDTLSKLREYHPQLGILLSIGGWGSGGFSEAAATPEGRELFANTALRILKEFQLDGIDLDWEYPCYSIAGIASRPADKQNFTLLLKEDRWSPLPFDHCRRSRPILSGRYRNGRSTNIPGLGATDDL